MVGRQDEARHRAFLGRALDLARKGWGHTAPNPMVGAVVVRDGEVVGEGWHTQFGEAHAEVEALRAAGDRARGSTVYVSLEPCTRWGKTPPCVDALKAAGVAAVIAASADINPAQQGGVAALREAGIEAQLLEVDDALELNAPFFNAFSSTRPWITAKAAVSLDGALADATRSPGWLTNAESRRHVHALRANSGAIAVGIGTVLADNPSLTVREGYSTRVPPSRVVFDRNSRTPLDSTLVRTAGDVPVIIVCGDESSVRATELRRAGCGIVEADSLKAALEALRGMGITAMLVEGGARIIGALLDADFVDRLVMMQAPIILGEESLNVFSGLSARRVDGARRLRVVERRAFGDDLMTVYALRELPSMPRGDS